MYKMLSKQTMYLLLILCFSSCALGFATDDEQEQEFVFTIPKMFSSQAPPRIMITTQSETPVVAIVNIPGYSITYNRTITRINGANIQLPVDIKMNLGDGKQNKTVFVRATDVVSVYAIDNESHDGDAFQCISSTHLGTKYSVASYQPYNEYSSFICVSALHSPTTVTISNATDIIHTFMLQGYESYRYDGHDFEDLSGLLVYSTKPIAVIAGSVARIPVNKNYGAGIVAQLLPLVSWGTMYYLFPFQGVSQFVYRVFSFNVSTTLHTLDGSVEDSHEIQRGEFFKYTTRNAVYLEADQPVMVAQYMRGYEVNGGFGDPSMLIVPPVSSYSNRVTFPVFKYLVYFTHTYYINIVTKCNNIDGILFDGNMSVASWNMLSTYDQSMCCVRSRVSTGFHSVTINQNATFFVSVYAVSEEGAASSYAYAANGLSAVDAQPPNPMVTTDISNSTKQPTSSGCSKFTIPDNSILTLEDDVYTIGHIVTVDCRQGFERIGDDSLLCGDTGDWLGKMPACVQRNSDSPEVIIINKRLLVLYVSVGGVILIAVVLIATVCCCLSRSKTSAPVINDNMETAIPNTASKDADDEGYEHPQDNAGYRDLELSTMTSSDYATVS